MVKQLFILLAVISCQMLVIGHVFQFDVEIGYKTLNEHLMKTVATDDLDENLAEIAKEANRLTVKDDRNYFHAVREVQKAARALEVDDKDDYPYAECGRFDNYLMENAAMHTNAHKHFVNPNAELNRIQLIVYKIGMKHAEMCKNVWPEIFRKFFPSFGEGILYTMAKKWQKEILSRKSSMSNRQYMEWLLDQDPQLSSDNYNAYVDQAAAYVKNLASENASESNHELLYGMYLQKPCSEFTKTLGEELLQNATFDAQMYPGNEGFVLEGDEENLINFYLAIAVDRNCSALKSETFKDAVFERLTKSQ